MIFIKILSLLAAVAGVFILYDNYSYLIQTSDQQAELLYSLMLVSFLLVNIFTNKTSVKSVVKMLSTWLVIFFGLFVAYSYKSQLLAVYDNVLQEINPSLAVSDGDGQVAIRRNIHGQYNVVALVDGIKVKFLVDTGASAVTLTYNDAKRVGIDVKRLRYNVVVHTANGTNKAAFIKMPVLQIGEIRVHNVKTLVTKKGLNSSLLGMSFLNRVSSFEFKNNNLIIVK